MFMQTLPLNALEKYVYTSLSAKAGKTKVYDFVPDEAKYPFYSIGDCSLEDWSSKWDNGTMVTYHITAWSDSKGMRMVNDMANTVMETFSDSRTALDDGFVLDSVELVGVDVQRHSNGEVRFAEISLRFLITELNPR
jgi:hypothetical protein